MFEDFQFTFQGLIRIRDIDVIEFHYHVNINA